MTANFALSPVEGIKQRNFHIFFVSEGFGGGSATIGSCSAAYLALDTKLSKEKM